MRKKYPDLIFWGGIDNNELLCNDSVEEVDDLAVLLNEVRNGYREMIENRLTVFRSTNICSFMSNVCELSFPSPYDKTDNHPASANIGILPNQKASPGSGNAIRQGDYSSPKLESMIEEITKQILSGLKGN